MSHFDYVPRLKWKQRYLVNTEHWGVVNGGGGGGGTGGGNGVGAEWPRGFPIDGCPGPILFYTGNESPVTDYYAASGLMTDVLAPRYGGTCSRRTFNCVNTFPQA